MKGYEWYRGLSEEECMRGAYWERNMLALAYAKRINNLYSAYMTIQGIKDFKLSCGWYYDTDNGWYGWKRVISLDNGKICFHIPDDFDVGTLPQIEPNWDGHTTKEKWDRIAAKHDITLEWEE